MTIDIHAIPTRLTQAGHKRLTAEQIEIIRRRLHERHPDDELNSIEAAIHAGVCVRTIKRAIDAGKGPHRGKNPDATGSGALNRHTKFRKGDLDAWRASLRSFDTFTGSFRSFDDLGNDAPWVMSGNRVVAHLFDVGNIEEVLAILATGEVEFFRLDEALRERWVDGSLRNSYQEQFTIILETIQRDIASAATRAILDVDTPEVFGTGPRPGM